MWGAVGRYRVPGPSTLSRHLADRRANQAAKRTTVYPSTESKELRAVMWLAHDLFGARGVVEYGTGPFGDYDGGPISIGVYLEPPRKVPPPRRTQEKFRGATIAELVEQVTLWKALR